MSHRCPHGHWVPAWPCRVCEAIYKPRPAAYTPHPLSAFWITLLTGIPSMPYVPRHTTHHTPETRARMREVAQEVGERPEVKEARRVVAKALWAKHGKEEMGRRISEGWRRNRETDIRTRAEKRAANIAAHLAKCNLKSE